MLGKLSDVGDAVTLPPDVLAPVPESATVCGLPLPVSETLRVAERDPLALGLNVTDTLQVAEAARLDPQVLLEMTKSPAFVPLTTTLLIVIVELVLLLSVAVFALLLEPTLTDPNENEVGLMVTLPLDPPGAKPDRATVCGELVAESLKVSVAVRVPPVVGLKVMFAVQLAPAARLVPQVLLYMRKSPGFAPLSVTPLIVMEFDPLLVNVATFCPPIPPTLTEAQLSDVGLADAVPPDVPPGAKPERATVCGLGVAESLKFSVAVRVPLAVGLNVMLAVQLAFAARLVPQVLLNILKSPALVPVIVTLLIVIALLLLFVSVATFCPPIPPTLTEAQLRLVGDTDAARAAAGSPATSRANALAPNPSRTERFEELIDF
ncbi:MAG TPA: hypothetical protein VGF82_10755 [Terracidiphilus sp.]